MKCFAEWIFALIEEVEAETITYFVYVEKQTEYIDLKGESNKKKLSDYVTNNWLGYGSEVLHGFPECPFG